jgi:hypothetical protein
MVGEPGVDLFALVGLSHSGLRAATNCADPGPLSGPGPCATVRLGEYCEESCAKRRFPVDGDADCGGGVVAGPSTSCPFALNVVERYNSVPGDSVVIDVYSPVMQQTYTMNCVRTSDTVTCRLPESSCGGIRSGCSPMVEPTVRLILMAGSSRNHREISPWLRASEALTPSIYSQVHKPFIDFSGFDWLDRSTLSNTSATEKVSEGA